MLSDEEKELVEKIQNGNKIGIYELIRTFKREGIENFITVRRKYIDIMINLIEKQSKEIEELKNGQIDFWISDKEIEERIRNKFVSKDKIKAKIEEYKKEIDKLYKKKNWYEPQDTVKKNKYMNYIEFGQSLLEKE